MNKWDPIDDMVMDTLDAAVATSLEGRGSMRARSRARMIQEREDARRPAKRGDA